MGTTVMAIERIICYKTGPTLFLPLTQQTTEEMAHNGRERGRLKIQFIMDNSKRKKVLSKRLPILLKKVRKLAALCDVPACLLVYLPGEAQPMVWPSSEAASEVLRRYRDLDYEFPRAGAERIVRAPRGGV
jgi:hypothetical protein